MSYAHTPFNLVTSSKNIVNSFFKLRRLTLCILNKYFLAIIFPFLIEK